MNFPVSPGALSAEEVRTIISRDEPLILEVGANCGQTTVEFLRTMPRATIHAFEPDPRAIAKFRRRIITAPRVYLHECAIGATNGTVTFHQSSGAEDEPDYQEGWDQSGSIRKPRTHLQVWPWVRFEKQIEVPIFTLDTWAERYQVTAADFIWADVQGAESDMIQGASRLLPSVRYLYTEYSNSEWYEGQITLPELAERLVGFELIRRFPMDALFRNTRC